MKKQICKKLSFSRLLKIENHQENVYCYVMKHIFVYTYTKYKNLILNWQQLAVLVVPTVFYDVTLNEAFCQLDGGLQAERNLFDIKNHQENVHCYVIG